MNEEILKALDTLLQKYQLFAKKTSKTRGLIMPLYTL